MNSLVTTVNRGNGRITQFGVIIVFDIELERLNMRVLFKVGEKILPGQFQREKTKKKRQPYKKHWYKQFTTECPLCGGGGTIRERVYGEKPTNPEEIYSFESLYDSCMAY